jgi:hypothetical protein
MEPTTTETRSQKPAGIAAWLRSDVTVTLPGWAIAAGAAALAALILVAVD